MLSEEVGTIWKVPYNLQLIAVFIIGEVEHTVCVYPKFWPESKYLHFRSKTTITNGGLFEIHCIPQHCSVRLPSEIGEFLTKYETTNKYSISTEKNSFGDSDAVEKVEVDREEDLYSLLIGVTNLCKLRTPLIESSINSSRGASQGTPFFLYKSFIEHIQPLMMDLKRTYKQVVKNTPNIQGRLTNRGMLQLVASPSTNFECEFDDFQVQSPIYRITTTCLQIVRSFSLEGRHNWLRDEAKSFRSTAHRIQRSLSGVDVYSSSYALRELEQFMNRPPRMFRKFLPLTGMMQAILKRDVQSLQSNDSDSVYYIYKDFTNLIWEAFLERVLKSCFSDVIPQANYQEAWDSVGGQKYVDFSYQKGKQLLDAKYMKEANTFASTYQHQMFFYAMAETSAQLSLTSYNSSKNEVGPERITLAYPISDYDGMSLPPPATEYSPSQSIERLMIKLNSRKTKLRRIGVPFPRPDHILDLSNQAEWVESFVKHYQDHFAKLFGGAV